MLENDVFTLRTQNEALRKDISSEQDRSVAFKSENEVKIPPTPNHPSLSSKKEKASLTDFLNTKKRNSFR